VADTQTDVLVAVYQELDAATMDFDSLMRIVDEKQAEIEGAILVTHDAQGEVTVVQHGDHLGRKGLGWGSGAGLVVGLFAPPLLGSIVVGAAAGGVIGRFTDHKVKAGMEELGERLPPGTAGIITVFDDEHRLAIEQALPGSPAKSIAQTDRQGVRALKAELGTAMGKFVQDRTVLPIPDRAFGGTAGRTLKDSVADWAMIPGPKAPEGAPNVLLVLIDDAGFGAPDTFGGPISTPSYTRV
jgi:arylsulfatase